MYDFITIYRGRLDVTEMDWGLLSYRHFCVSDTGVMTDCMLFHWVGIYSGGWGNRHTSKACEENRHDVDGRVAYKATENGDNILMSLFLIF